MRRLLLSLLVALAACDGAQISDTPAQAAASCTGLSKPAMVWIAGGRFTMGEAARYPEEGPPREAAVTGFWMSQTEVTNAQFAAFVAATGYRTEAERDPPALPGAPPEMRLPGSAVFRLPTPDNRNWWAWVPGANWQHPSGPQSTIAGRETDPVVQVTYNDALAYARWAGLSLPSEEQWEFAARAGAEALPEPKDTEGKPIANYYQGVFPARDLGEDGFTARAPVGCFPANAYGLHDMIGNVWEWTTDWYAAKHETREKGEAKEGTEADGGPGKSSCCAIDNPRGPAMAGSYDPTQPTTPIPRKVLKGGSFLCAPSYCRRYRPAARHAQMVDTGMSHLGFRCVQRGPRPRS